MVSLPHPVDIAYDYLKVQYDTSHEIAYTHETGRLGLAEADMYWRPLKYWINLFAELGFVVAAVDEPCKGEGLLPRRFNARFEIR